jgi:UDP-glucose 4-epimerase
VNNTILLTGGAGYIGSHTFVALVQAGYKPVILDNFSNSDAAVLERLERLTGQQPICEEGDVLDTAFVTEALRRHQCVAAIHFAGLKAVGESVQQPLKYYHINVGGLISLLQAMQIAGCRAVVFSSSATVYGDPAHVPVNENASLSAESPYARSKLMCEQILGSIGVPEPAWGVGVLRYFNPVGAHTSGLIGENPTGIPNNLMPYLTQVAIGKRDKLRIFGNDYETPDGTGIRDYLHVMDLAEGHVAAVRALLTTGESFTVNLGTGQGTSVLGVLQAFERASGRQVAHEFAPRRPGDVAKNFAEVSLAAKLLGWRAKRTIDDMCRDSWRWQQGNPDGYKTASGTAHHLSHGDIAERANVNEVGEPFPPAVRA